MKELLLQVRAATGQLTQDLGRTPTESDLVRHLGVSRDELRQAQRAELAFQPSSLAVATHWSGLPTREQKILQMEFRGRMTKTEIGRQLQISQMHVSRLRAHALGYLRSQLLDLAGTQAQASQG